MRAGLRAKRLSHCELSGRQPRDAVKPIRTGPRIQSAFAVPTALERQLALLFARLSETEEKLCLTGKPFLFQLSQLPF
jgi:hypothetical protein